MSATKEEAFYAGSTAALPNVAPSAFQHQRQSAGRAQPKLRNSSSWSLHANDSAGRMVISICRLSSTGVRPSTTVSTILGDRNASLMMASDVALLQRFAPRNLSRRAHSTRGDFLEPSPRARHGLEQRWIGFPWHIRSTSLSIRVAICNIISGIRRPDHGPFGW